MTQPRAQQRIDEALAGLKGLLEQAVREEQLIDRLTKLGNDEALIEWIQGCLDVGGPFWLAFIEVDRFKSVNDEFGYDAADELLRRIAEQLRNGASNYFGSAATPFRAHGDEFFLGGSGVEGEVGEALEQIRSSIAALRVPSPTQPNGGLMRCTVSVGWASNQDVLAAGLEVLTVRELRGALESTVGVAKIRRDVVVRYSADVQKTPMRSGRADCPTCGTKFDLRIPVGDNRFDDLVCPNCGGAVARPPGLHPQQG
jgi:diguanylate cyclase (GGDEF)-like protein